MRLNEDEAL